MISLLVLTREYSGVNGFVATPKDTVMLPGITTTGLASATLGHAPTGNAKSEFDIQNLSFILVTNPQKLESLCGASLSNF